MAGSPGIFYYKIYILVLTLPGKNTGNITYCRYRL
jgi:hypothetical protein